MPFCATGSSVDERDDIVDAAVVLGDREPRVEMPVASTVNRPSEDVDSVVLLPAEVIVVFDHPAARHGLPRELDGLPCGKIRCGDVHLAPTVVAP
jgi:hypothetical protein